MTKDRGLCDTRIYCACIVGSLLMAHAGLSAEQQSPLNAADDPTPTQIQFLQHQIASRLIDAPAPGATGRILPLAGEPCPVSKAQTKGLLRWVAAGNACWLDPQLAGRIGLSASYAGSVRKAIVIPAARDHPLVAGVESILAGDTFAYVRGLPPEAQPVIAACNRPQHVVVAAWPFGKGIFVVRPAPRPATVSLLSAGERRWIDPDAADGRRLLHNINVVTLAALGASRPSPMATPVTRAHLLTVRPMARPPALTAPPGLRPRWVPGPLLAAFRATGTRG